MKWGKDRAGLQFLLLFAAALCLAIALLIDVNAITATNETAWRDGGLLAFVLSFLP